MLNEDNFFKLLSIYSTLLVTYLICIILMEELNSITKR